jgi:spermidine synthase
MLGACLLSFCIGFLSLSQEILWVRLFGFANYSLPQAFAFVLTMYLIGIAVGAVVGRYFCTRRHNLWEISGYILLIASLFDLLAPWMYVSSGFGSWQIAFGGLLMLLMAGLKAILFPIAHHLGAPPFGPNVGRSVSRVYAANILGATLGPVVTGMIMLNVMTTQDCFAVCAELTFVTGMFCFRDDFEAPTVFLGMFFAMLILGFITVQEPIQMLGKVAKPDGEIHRIIETRQGVVTIYKRENGGDVVYGGNVYDGRTNLDPVINSNRINRLLILAAVQDQPKNVLMIGLSIGSWLKLLTTFSGVQNIDVVEINPGYLQAITDYPAQESALLDKRVHIYIDDGRRWLATHPDKKYDLIIMNTSYHWRAYASTLLSREFLLILKAHLQQDGVLSYNATGSPFALRTADHVFLHAYLYENFVIAADFDWRKRLLAPGAIAALASLNDHGKPVFPAGSEDLIKHYLSEKIVSDKNTPESEIITDDNLITEYKYGRTLTRY